jgi:MFS family permease
LSTPRESSSEPAVALPATGGQGTARATALRFVVLLGIVSMFSDMTHEGARSITGPFLGTLGASGAVVAIVAGGGEFVGYALRFVSGYAADRTSMYWPITLFGYAVQMLAVPLLALAGQWPVAALLIVAERAGRAVRNPPRDAMLAHATGELGSGWVFGLREALDAAGAMIGPLLIAAIVYFRAGYRLGFAALAVPALLTLAVLLGAWRQYPHPHRLEIRERPPEGRGLPRVFWIYLAGMALIAAAYVDYPLIAYHFGRAGIVAPLWIPILYAVAMATEAASALVLGRLFDRIGLRTVIVATALTALFPPLVFLGGAALAVVGMVLWGLGMAAQESVVKAAITGMVAPNRRASAYGLFDTAYGLAWMLGSAALGLLYDRSIGALVIVSCGLQVAAIPFLASARTELSRLFVFRTGTAASN